MNTGTLSLLPCPIDERTGVWDVLPAANRAVMASLDYFIVENIRTARRFLSRAALGRPVESLAFAELNEHTDTGRELEELMRPLREGRSFGMISEAGLSERRSIRCLSRKIWYLCKLKLRKECNLLEMSVG